MVDRKIVLLSWVAVNNDPYERERVSGAYRLVNGHPVPGPTLTLINDPESPYAGRVSDYVMLHRVTRDGAEGRESLAVADTMEALKQKVPGLRIHGETWVGEDPTDHQAIFEFLRERLPAIRRKFSSRELLLHASPGTPSMQTVLILMAETGFIEPPFQVVKSYRKDERHGRPAVVPIHLGIDTYYKAYKASRPLDPGADEQSIILDPTKFCSDGMKRLFAEARRVAQINVPVLILGERGTGKTTLAAWIRSHSPYRKPDRDASWPAVACGQYTTETMRSELFGYKKGAFTGALADRDGLLDAAHQDTLFLDEIGDISRELQRLLVKALEEKRYFRLGDERPRDSDFRLISATNLDANVLRDRIDADFLDRISLFKLTVPPLREVREEIPWLWEAVYERASIRAGAGRARTRLGQEYHRRIVRELSGHPLPGNLRDLFRLAYRVIAARADAHDPASPDDAVSYGLESLNEASELSGVETMPRRVAKAFAEQSPLTVVIDSGGPINTREIDRSFKAYLACELRRYGRAKGKSPEVFCDVTDRSLREWLSEK